MVVELICGDLEVVDEGSFKRVTAHAVRDEDLRIDNRQQNNIAQILMRAGKREVIEALKSTDFSPGDIVDFDPMWA
ncbi:MAG: hypothetical protein PVJ39_04665 [Gammaproteobacteria bacterium]|jgi:hypothetical protein